MSSTIWTMLVITYLRGDYTTNPLLYYNRYNQRGQGLVWGWKLRNLLRFAQYETF